MKGVKGDAIVYKRPNGQPPVSKCIINHCYCYLSCKLLYIISPNNRLSLRHLWTPVCFQLWATESHALSSLRAQTVSSSDTDGLPTYRHLNVEQCVSRHFSSFLPLFASNYKHRSDVQATFLIKSSCYCILFDTSVDVYELKQITAKSNNG